MLQKECCEKVGVISVHLCAVCVNRSERSVTISVKMFSVFSLGQGFSLWDEVSVVLDQISTGNIHSVVQGIE